MSDNLFKKAIQLKRKDFKITSTGVEIINKEFKNVEGGCLLIYAPWCPHCINKNDLINNLSDFVKTNYKGYKIAVASGDDKEMEDILKKLNQNGFPTFYHLKCYSNNPEKVDVIEFGQAGRDLINLFQ